MREIKAIPKGVYYAGFPGGADYQEACIRHAHLHVDHGL